MGQGGLATQLWYATPALRRVSITALILLVGVVSYASVALREAGSPVAAWWPAAGVAVVAVLASRGSRVTVSLGVFVVAVAANALLGRELGLSLGYGVANAAEAYVVAQFASRGGPEARLDSLRDVSRFIGAAVLGALTIGVLGSLTAFFAIGADGPSTLLSLIASHGSAILVVAPIALVSRRLIRRVSPIEFVAQIGTLAALVLYVFWPGNVLPLAFVPLIALLWGAFRLPTTLVAIELLMLTVLTTSLTGAGGGPFGVYAESDPRIAGLLVQIFLIVHACAALFVSAARNDWANVVTQLGARESLLRGGIVNSDTGILIAEIVDGDRLRVVGVNAPALGALGRVTMPPTWGVVGLRIAWDETIFGVAELDEAVHRREATRLELDRDGRRFDVDLALHDGTGDTTVVTMVFTDVTARDERERRALDAADRLRDLNRQKDDFIASVSHELRTPVTSILGFVEDLEGADLGSRERQATEIIARNARRLADVIEDVLELGKLSSPASVARAPSEFDIVDLVRHCAQDTQGLAVGREVRIDVRSAVEPLMIRTVPQDVTRVLANLLSNAVKFSPRGGLVDVVIFAEDGGVRIDVVDRGPGIPPGRPASRLGAFLPRSGRSPSRCSGNGARPADRPGARRAASRRRRGAALGRPDGNDRESPPALGPGHAHPEAGGRALRCGDRGRRRVRSARRGRPRVVARPVGELPAEPRAVGERRRRDGRAQVGGVDPRPLRDLVGSG